MEKDSRTASRKFWSTIRRLRRGEQCTTNTVYSGDGAPLTSTRDVASRWGEYFEDLLNSTDTPSREGAESGFSEAGSPISGVEVTEVVKKLLGGMAPGVEEIRPEFLKALEVVGLSWLACFCNIAWTVPLDWQTGEVVPLFKKGDRMVWSNYTLLSSLPKAAPSHSSASPVRSIQRCRRGGSVGKSNLRFRRSSVVFALAVEQRTSSTTSAGSSRVPGSSSNQSTCVLWTWRRRSTVSLGESCGGFLREYGVPNPLIRAVRSPYDRSQSLVRIAGSKSDSFPVRVGLRRGCSLSPIVFVTFMDRMSRRSRGVEGVRFGGLSIASLLFADDAVLLASSSRDLQLSPERFAAECEAVGMRIGTSESETVVLSRKRVACPLRVGDEILPRVEEFKYLGVSFTSEGRTEREIDKRIGAASAAMRTSYRSVVVKKELGRKAKLSIYRSISVPPLTGGHELRVVTQRTRSRIPAAEMSFLRRVSGLSLRDPVRSSVIREDLRVEPLLLRIERSQMRRLGHLIRTPPR
ncbi:uncharacterized protein LOC133404806 [Phycodurus eques]|uniref:uncharacterized protein LOC133404806 n=1 Tax=Phycodurus eques TaxID=693459 RepID=UPI002ACDD35F|nr:uncharacterized protein LOC133404806 [Phycodurus eques]